MKKYSLPSISPGCGGRVVTDTDMASEASVSISRPASVVLPAPEGEDSTKSSPRLSIRGGGACGLVSLNVLHLLSHLIDHRLQFQAGAGGFFVVGFGAQGIGFAVELLGQEIEAASGRQARAQQFARGRDVAADAFEFLLHIGAAGQNCRLLIEPRLIEVCVALEQPSDLLLEPGTDSLERARRQAGDVGNQTLNARKLLEHDRCQP